MKSLLEFKTIVEEEKSDYSKFDALVRAGLANKAQIQRIHKILDKMGEDKPVFNNADRMIMQNLFNKMVDLISNNKSINLQARRAVREDVDVIEPIDEALLATSDYKLGTDGRKVRAHRIKVGDKVEEAVKDDSNDPPFVLLLKRRAIRLYPDKTKVALYYNKQLDKYFSVPFNTEIGSYIQAEETNLEEGVMDQLHKIVSNKQATRVKFGNGQSKTVDHYTASAITQVHKALNDDNKKKFADMVHKSPAHLAKASDFAFSKVK